MQGDLDQFRTALKFQLTSYVRTWRFLGLVLFVGAVSLAVVGIDVAGGVDKLTAKYPDAASFLGNFLGSVTDAVIITAAFLGGDALAVDLGGGPGYLMLTQPVRRGTLLAGRFVAAALAGFAVALVYYAVAIGAALGFYRSLPVSVAVSFGGAMLFGLAALAVAFFFSSFFRNPTVAIIASFLILLLALPLVSAIGTFTGAEPWYSMTYGAEIITGAFANPFVHESTMSIPVRQGVTLTLYSWYPYLWEGIVILVGYLAGFLGLSYLVYRTKEVKG